MRLIFLLLSSFCFANDPGVTYEFSGGRFGDNLLSYLHAKWISYEQNIPLYYKPFPYSEALSLAKREKSYSDPSSLRICPYFPEDPWERSHTQNAQGLPWTYFQVDWKDKEFRKIVWEMISPDKPLNCIIPPQNTLNIALHIREGGGVDKQERPPLKLPPLKFYIRGLLKAIELSKGEKIYCYLFTDARHPEKLIKQIKKSIPRKTPIAFHYRKENRHDANVLEDFFSLFNFDILIHSQSNFSLIPSLLHDYAMTYSPKSFIIKKNKPKITEINLTLNQDLLENALHRTEKK